MGAYDVIALILTGMMISLLYDFFIWMTEGIRGGFGFVLQMLFWSGMALLCFRYLYYANYGELGFYTFLFLGIGGISYRGIKKGMKIKPE